MPGVETRPFAPQQEITPMNITLANNSLLNDFVHHLKNTPVDWERTVYEADPHAKLRTDSRDRTLFHFQGDLLEAHLRIQLHDFANDHTEVTTPLMTEPQRAGDYAFYPEGGGLKLAITYDGTNEDDIPVAYPYTDIDACARFADVVTIFEAKVEKRNGSQRGTISSSLKHELLGRKLLPFTVLFDSAKFAAVLVTTQNRVASSDALEDFSQKGGIVAEIPESYNEFVGQVKHHWTSYTAN